jgi:hypothetical protein
MDNYLRRYEQKYLLNSFQHDALMETLEEIAAVDEYGASDIYSIYFDTDDFSSMRKCMDNKGFKEKLRLRSYGLPGANDKVYLELKKKFQGVTFKRRTPVLYKDLESYLATRYQQTPEQADSEIDWFLHSHKPVPQFLVCCKRIAMKGIDNPEFRVTLDTRLLCRRSGLDLSGGFNGVPMIAANEFLMEIKTADAIPYRLCRRLSELRIYPASFSKSQIACAMLSESENEGKTPAAYLFAAPTETPERVSA